MPTDKQYDGQLIEEYQRLERILKTAKKGNSSETIAVIEDEMKYLRLKLQPLQLPDMQEEVSGSNSN